MYADVFPHNLKDWNNSSQTLNINLGQGLLMHADDPKRFSRKADMSETGPTIRLGMGSRWREYSHRGTDDQPVYRVFNWLKVFTLDVPDGAYEVTLHFTEPFKQHVRENANESWCWLNGNHLTSD